MKTWLEQRLSAFDWILDDDGEAGADVDDWVEMTHVKLVCEREGERERGEREQFKKKMYVYNLFIIDQLLID